MMDVKGKKKINFRFGKLNIVYKEGCDETSKV